MSCHIEGAHQHQRHKRDVQRRRAGTYRLREEPPAKLRTAYPPFQAPAWWQFPVRLWRSRKAILRREN